MIKLLQQVRWKDLVVSWLESPPAVTLPSRRKSRIVPNGGG
jgi:hypothetical protein